MGPELSFSKRESIVHVGEGVIGRGRMQLGQRSG